MKKYIREVQGFNFGFIYKDYEEYLKGDTVCYIGEFATEKNVLTEEEANQVGYTRFQLEALCAPYGLDTDYLFETLDWQSPETLVDEMVTNIENDNYLLTTEGEIL